MTTYLDFHPGGVPELMRAAGRDATSLFNQYHAWVNYESMLKSCLVGRFTGDLTKCECSLLQYFVTSSRHLCAVHIVTFHFFQNTNNSVLPCDPPTVDETVNTSREQSNGFVTPLITSGNLLGIEYVYFDCYQSYAVTF